MSIEFLFLFKKEWRILLPFIGPLISLVWTSGDTVSTMDFKFSIEPLTVADPGFSPGECANSQNYYYFSNFCWKLHENERIWTPRGGARPWRPPLRSANVSLVCFINCVPWRFQVLLGVWHLSTSWQPSPLPTHFSSSSGSWTHAHDVSRLVIELQEFNFVEFCNTENFKEWVY